ncbi:MAG: fibronectin type III domain-containing protein, partial [Lentisphaerae bacterium]|nr:fibronectin type III domain-containing protein [Lentisphaerota bacterium]
YPTDDETYNTANGDVSITVNKADPSVTTWPTASAITYGQTLADSTLSGGEASVAGSFDWTTPATAPAAGTADQSVTFTPTDADNYETVVFDVSVTVGKAIPTITTEPTASAITYGQTLADSTLSGGEASVAGAFDWTTPATAPDVGTADQSVTFTPTDADNYEAVVFDVSVTVGKATPTITTPPEAGNIVVGQTLASSTLSGGEASVAGSFAWTDDSIEPLEGKADQSVTFTPTDGDNYETVVFDVSVTTLATEPEEHSASMAVTDPTAESLTLTWTIGSGERRIVVVRALYAVNWTPTDGVSPTGVNVDFSAAADQGNGNKICYDGAGNSVTLTGLTPNTLYWFKVFEYNGSKFGAKGLNTTGTENYYTDDIPLEGSGSTLPTSVVLYYFVAGAENGQAVLRWRTASEIDTVGFWVERQVGGAWMRVNDKIIYGKGEMGATYALVDAGAEIGGTYTWRIVEIETDGGQQIHGPFTRTVSELGFAAENPITVTPDGVLIRWLSREGESYKILRSTDLTQGFGVIEEDISATVPENEFLDETAGSIGMYLIQVDDE